ncbi:MAG: DUF5011 domain-containing protein, partial [Anaerolineae bacterium]|nr:DUF5011 domain-containing protein [Anaerolineae bacterium]
VLPMNARLVMTNSIVSHSSAANGGGISILNGTATLTNTTLKENTARYGGGLYAEDSSLTISSSKISFNQAIDPELPIGWGGGLYAINAVGTVKITLQDTEILENHVSGMYGGLNIAVRNASEVSLSRVKVSGNTAQNTLGGGQIYSEGTLPVQIRDSRFEHNGAYTGGGIAVRNANLVNVIIQNNGSLSGIGGLTTHGNVSVSSSRILNNSQNLRVRHDHPVRVFSTTFSMGGGIRNLGSLTIQDSVVSNNSMDFGPGGGIYNDGTLQITRSTVSGNRAANGGAVYNGGNVTITQSCVVNNSLPAIVNGSSQSTGGTIKGTVLPEAQVLEGTAACAAHPAIFLEGSTPLEVEVGSPYKEPGVTALDVEDGDLTDAVQVDTSAVNTAVPGSYEVIYSVVDSSGENATVSRTVNVVDTTPPVMTLHGETEVTLYAGENYTEAGATAADNYDGDLTAQITVSGSVDPFTEGTYVVEYRVTDSSGNTAFAIRTITVTMPSGVNAGMDETYSDADGDGEEAVPLTATSDKAMISYSWLLNGQEIAVEESATAYVPVGVNEVLLTVTDENGLTYSDTVVITVLGETADIAETTICAAGDMTVSGITDGQILTGWVRIQAEFTGTPSRVDFALTGPDGSTYIHTESSAPYYFLGDENGIPYGWNTAIYPLGSYTLTITAYDRETACVSQAFTLEVVQ